MNQNLFTTSDAELLSVIMRSIEKLGSILVMADRDADLLIWRNGEVTGQKHRLTHPEQFIGNYGKRSDPLEIAEDLLARKAELLKYGRDQRELHPHLRWAR